MVGFSLLVIAAFSCAFGVVIAAAPYAGIITLENFSVLLGIWTLNALFGVVFGMGTLALCGWGRDAACVAVFGVPIFFVGVTLGLGSHTPYMLTMSPPIAWLFGYLLGCSGTEYFWYTDEGDPDGGEEIPKIKNEVESADKKVLRLPDRPRKAS